MNNHNYRNFLHKNTPLYAVGFVAFFAAFEAFFGFWSGSLTLLSDAGHMCADSMALLMAGVAIWIKRRPPTAKHTYGFARIEVITSWVSSLLLITIVIGIFLEAIDRFRTPHHIAGKTVIIVAIIGLIVNILTAIVLNQGEKTINIRAALLHVFSDLLASIAVLISGLVIYFTGWTLIDPILSLFICFLIIISTINLLREAFVILMEGAPSNIDTTKIEQTLLQFTGVKTIHDLHVWTLTSGTTLLTTHVVVEDSSFWPKIVDDLRAILKEKFNIEHSTIQVEGPTQDITCLDCNGNKS